MLKLALAAAAALFVLPAFGQQLQPACDLAHARRRCRAAASTCSASRRCVSRRCPRSRCGMGPCSAWYSCSMAARSAAPTTPTPNTRHQPAGEQLLSSPLWTALLALAAAMLVCGWFGLKAPTFSAPASRGQIGIASWYGAESGNWTARPRFGPEGHDRRHAGESHARQARSGHRSAGREEQRGVGQRSRRRGCTGS